LYINPTLFGADITGVNRPVSYKCKMFSLSSVLKDMQGEIIAQQKRSSWWRLVFEMQTEEGEYKFYEKFGAYYLEHETGETFFTHNSMGFYNKYMKSVTDLKYTKKFGKMWELDLLTDKHQSAFVLASVTMCKLNPAI